MNKKDLAPVVIGKLLNIGGVLQKRGNQLLSPFSLNQQQYSILFAIEEKGRVKQKDMVNKLLLEKAHVSKVVKKLQAMGLIEVTLSEKDKRSSWLSITKKGTTTVEDCRKVLYQWNEDWVSEVNDEQMKTIVDSLDLLQNLFIKKSIEQGIDLS